MDTDGYVWFEAATERICGKDRYEEMELFLDNHVPKGKLISLNKLTVEVLYFGPDLKCDVGWVETEKRWKWTLVQSQP